MSICSQCGATVLWTRVSKRRKQCYNPDGSVHWDECSRLRFERVKRTGEHFHGTDYTAEGDKLHTEGYRSPFKTQLVGIRLDKLATGKDYRASGCDCDLPPWELCKPDCQHAIGARHG